MKRLLSSLFLGMLSLLTATAGIISQEAARLKVTEFLSVRKGIQVRAADGSGTGLSLTLTGDSRHGGFFVYNVGQNDGFVIVSASDRTDEILGYSDTGAFDSNDMPDNLRAWLDDYRHQIEYMERNSITGRQQRLAAPKASVPELMKSCWGQDAPFNNRCPQYKEDRAVTGCVVTAMAQLMYYHKFPNSAPPLPGYKSSTASFGDIDMPDLPATTFDWSKMYDSYKSGEDGAEVAKLMLYCGTAVQVNYGKSGSDAWSGDVTSKLAEYFGYDGGARFISRSSYYYDEWAQLIYDELAASRPVLLSGQSIGGGHAFICDGYDSSTDMYHINWGWDGNSNAFFRLSLLSPTEQGVGGSNSNDGFNLYLHAGIGIRPATGETVAVSKALTLRNLTLGDTEFNMLTRSDANSNFCITPQIRVMNFSGGTHTYKWGVRLRKGDTIVKTDNWTGEGVTLDHNSGRSQWLTYFLGKGLANGTYRLEAVYQADDDTEWQVCERGDKNYLELTIDGNELTVNTVEQATYQLEVESVSYSHEKVVQGEPEVATIVIKNTGGEPYHGDITFLTAWDGGKELWGGTAVDIDPDATATVKVEHTPTRYGVFKAMVYQGFFDDGVLLSESTLEIAKSNASATQADLSFSVTVDNALGDKILGNTAKLKMTVTNKSDALYRGAVYHIVWTWNGNSAEGISSGFIETIPANTTVELERTVEGLQPGVTYSFSSAYQRNNEILQDQTGIYTFYKTVDAYTIYNAAGVTTTEEATETVVVPEEAVCVDLRGQKTVKTVTPNDNPNVLYLLDEGAATPQGINTNIVKGSTAESIELADGHNFYNPIEFTAKKINYSRIFARGTDGTDAWATLMLPFTATSVTASSGSTDGKAIDWYHGETDEDKDFWLRTFASDKDDTFSFIDNTEATIEAYAPYLIAVPGDRWGEERSMEGHELVFSAENASVGKDRRVVYTGDTFRFWGTLQALDLAGMWKLNADGNLFVRTEGTVMPFRAVFTLNEAGTEAPDTLAVPPLSKTMGIELPSSNTHHPSPNTQRPAYRLDGTPLNGTAARLPRGIYIIKGKKICLPSSSYYRY